MSANIKKVLGWLVVGFAAFYLITNPGSAADGVRGVGSFIADAFGSLITFLTGVFS